MRRGGGLNFILYLKAYIYKYEKPVPVSKYISVGESAAASAHVDFGKCVLIS